MKTLLLCVALLGGCTDTIKGVEISEAEREACEAQSCTVWTPAELTDLLRRVWHGGYTAGAKSI